MSDAGFQNHGQRSHSSRGRRGGGGGGGGLEKETKGGCGVVVVGAGGGDGGFPWQILGEGSKHSHSSMAASHNPPLRAGFPSGGIPYV